MIDKRLLDVVEWTRAGRVAYFGERLVCCDGCGYAADHPFRAQTERCLAYWRDTPAARMLADRPFLGHGVAT